MMRIGLLDVDGHSTKAQRGGKAYPNLALTKLARWHKVQGDVVEWYNPFDNYDRVYMAKVFTFTPDYGYIIRNADEVVKGGTGYDSTIKLPDEVDRVQPDYTIYPELDKRTAYGFLTRGCIRRCPWCVVPKKEGYIHPYMDVDEIAIEGRTNLVLMDNNVLACDYGLEQIEKIVKRGYRVDFNQAMDARLVTDEVAALLARVRWMDRRIRFGCDTAAQVEDCERAIERLQRHGYRGEFFLYTMLHGSLQECYERVHHWWVRNHDCRARHLPNIYPFAQPMLNLNSQRQDIPQWQKDMAGWVNKHQIFQMVDFMDFEPRKGFKCSKYFKKQQRYEKI